MCTFDIVANNADRKPKTLFTDMASNLGVFTLLMVGVNVGGGQKQ